MSVNTFKTRERNHVSSVFFCPATSSQVSLVNLAGLSFSLTPHHAKHGSHSKVLNHIGRGPETVGPDFFCLWKYGRIGNRYRFKKEWLDDFIINGGQS